jgi:gliding motility-associated-like protein
MNVLNWIYLRNTIKYWVGLQPLLLLSTFIRLKNNEVFIYDRNGNKVFETNNYDNDNAVWEGNNLSGGPLPSDTYFYIFTAGDIKEKGWIELTR